MDPSNTYLDTIVPLVKAWPWMSVDDVYVKAIHRKADGSGGACSSQGRVNLRGSILEMSFGQLQAMGAQDWWQDHGNSKGGKGGGWSAGLRAKW